MGASNKKSDQRDTLMGFLAIGLLIVVWWPLSHLTIGLKTYLSFASIVFSMFVTGSGGDKDQKTRKDCFAILACLGLCYLIWWQAADWNFWLRILLTLFALVPTAMNLAELFKPKWKRSDPKCRKEAVGTIQDKAILTGMALTDSNRDVRKAAVGGIQDEDTLCRIVTNDSSDEVETVAVGRISSEKILTALAVIGLRNAKGKGWACQYLWHEN